MDNNCVVCEQALRRRRRHVLNQDFLQSRPNFREHIPQNVPFNGTRWMCNACWQSIYRRVNPPGEPPRARIPIENNCISCHRSLRRRRRHILTADILQTQRVVVEHILRDVQPPQEIPLDGTRALCHGCWMRIVDAAPPPPAPPLVPNAGSSLLVSGLTRAANTSRRCMINNCQGQQLTAMPNSVKVYLLSYFHLYIPELARICRPHLQTLSIDQFPENVIHQESSISGDNVMNIINMYTEAQERKSHLNFGNIQDISEKDLKFWTGLGHEKFNILFNQLRSLQQRSHTPKLDLAVYLCKLRNAEPNARLASLFNCSKRSIARKIRLARTCLTADFVPLHIGLDHITRNEMIDRNRTLPNYVFGDEEFPKAVVILDGTYIFVEKSTNYLFQRRSYSLHKYRNLIKPFMIVCADGHILDISGPYPATTTDADILRTILNNNGGPIEDCVWHYFFHQNDVLVVDRGFRDAIPDAESCGYEVHMPPSTRNGERQLSTEDSNKSRLVTICRWVVEAINGRLKRDFKMFRHRTFNRDLPHCFEDFKIAGALVNGFQEPFDDSPYTEEFCQIIHRNLHKPNVLADYVQDNNLNQQRVPFTRLEANSLEVNDFPRLSYEDLILIAVGTYHPRIARSYCSEHIHRTGVYEIEVYRHRIEMQENIVLLRCRIQSRHVRTRTYFTYVLFNNRIEGRNAIIDYYCACIHGRRTLGVCAHVMSIIYYLGWARHEGELRHPAQFLDFVLRDLENI